MLSVQDAHTTRKHVANEPLVVGCSEEPAMGGRWACVGLVDGLVLSCMAQLLGTAQVQQNMS